MKACSERARECVENITNAACISKCFLSASLSLVQLYVSVSTLMLLSKCFYLGPVAIIQSTASRRGCTERALGAMRGKKPLTPRLLLRLSHNGLPRRRSASMIASRNECTCCFLHQGTPKVPQDAKATLSAFLPRNEQVTRPFPNVSPTT